MALKTTRCTDSALTGIPERPCPPAVLWRSGLVRYDRRQIGHCCGPVGTNLGTVSLQVHRRRRIVACGSPQRQGCQPMITNPTYFLKLKCSSANSFRRWLRLGKHGNLPTGKVSLICWFAHASSRKTGHALFRRSPAALIIQLPTIKV
jgi:hypothetical protein